MPSSRFFPMDGGDNAHVVIDSTHHEVHEGHLYEFHYDDLAPASGLSTYIHIKTGEIKVHTFLEFQVSGGNLKIQMFENATVGTAGSAINVYNLNRAASTSFTTLIYLNSTVGTTGTAFATKTLLASSTTQSKANSAVKEFAERIFAPNKDYIIKILTTTTGQAFTVDGILGEHN